MKITLRSAPIYEPVGYYSRGSPAPLSNFVIHFELLLMENFSNTMFTQRSRFTMLCNGYRD